MVMAEIAEKMREIGRLFALAGKNVEMAAEIATAKNDASSTIDSKEEFNGQKLREISSRVTVAVQNMKDLKILAEDLLQMITDELGGKSTKKMDVVAMANLGSRLCHISRCLVQSAISLEKAAEALDPDQLAEETEKNDTDSNGSGKMTNGFILSEIGGKIRDIGGHVRLAALKIKNASDALNSDQPTQESEKNDDGKRGQDQLYDGDFEIYHTARLTSADLAGRSAEDQRQITQAEWGLMSDGAKQCFTGQALEEELNPAKKGRLDD